MKLARGHTTQLAFIVGHSFSCKDVGSERPPFTPFLASVALDTLTRHSQSREAFTEELAGGGTCLNDERYLLGCALHGFQGSKEHDGGDWRKQQLVHQQLADDCRPAGRPLWQYACF